MQVFRLLTNCIILLSDVLTHIDEMVFIKDKNLKYIYVNEAFCKFLGKEKNEIIGKTGSQVLNVPSANKWESYAQEVLNNAEPVYFEEKFSNNKQDINLSIAKFPIFNKQKEIIGIQGLVSVVNNNEETIKLLKQSENRYNSILQTQNEMICRFLPDTTLTFVNDAYCKMFNTKREKILGKKFLELFPIEEHSAILDKIKNTNQNENIKEYEHKVTYKNGKIGWYKWTDYAFFDSDGNLLEFQSVGRDITERKLFEEKLQKINKQLLLESEQNRKLLKELIKSQSQLSTLNKELENRIVERTKKYLEAKEKAEESDKLKTAFLQNMSHEIRTPMNAIIGFANLLVENDISNEDRKEFAEILNQSCYRLLDIVNDILDISMIDTGQMTCKVAPVNIQRVMQDLFDFHKSNFKINKLDFSLNNRPDSDELIIYSDEQKINRILAIFLSNALKFTENGKVEFGYNLIGDNIEFYVQDTGIGISDDAKDMIFTRFYQEELALTRSKEGTGLGLPIARGLVELLNGKLNFKTQKGVGSIFSFNIPTNIKRYLDNNNHGFYKIKSIIPDFSDITILIAEDQKMNYLLIEKILVKSSNSKLIWVKNGREAVQECQSNPDISLIIMDIKMPVMDGYQATKLIKEFDKDIPIIAITAFAFDEDRRKALKTGFDDYIAKPIDPKALISLIAKYVKK